MNPQSAELEIAAVTEGGFLEKIQTILRYIALDFLQYLCEWKTKLTKTNTEE